MKKKILKILIIILFLSFIVLPKNYVYAGEEGKSEEPKVYSVKNIFTDAEIFITKGNDVNTMINTTALKNTSTFIYQILFSIGLVVAIIVGIILGIQFMVASAVDKAKIKETLIAYVVGCVVLFGAFGIWRTVINIMKGTTTTTTTTTGN